MKKIATATAAFTVFLVLSFASAAVAGGNGAVTFTQNDHGVTQSFVDVIPCGTGGGAAAVITTTTNDVFRGTVSHWVVSRTPDP